MEPDWGLFIVIAIVVLGGLITSTVQKTKRENAAHARMIAARHATPQSQYNGESDPRIKAARQLLQKVRCSYCGQLSASAICGNCGAPR